MGEVPASPSVAPHGPSRALSVLRLGIVAAVLAAVLAGCGGAAPADRADDGSPVSGVKVDDPDGLNGVVLPTAYRLADVTLRDTSGAPYDLASDPDKPLTLVFFGYTHCPDICQVVMANIASALVRLDPAQRAQVDMIFVTTDPARDTPSVLRSYVHRFDPRFQGLTGDLPSIVRAGKAFQVEITRGQKLASGGYDVGHGTQVVGILPDHTAPYVWTEGTDPASLAEDVRTILEDKVPGR